jgi:Flavin reductase like domain
MQVGDQFVLNVLGEDGAAPLMKHFLKRFPPGADRFEGVRTGTAPNGVPYLTDSIAHIELTVRPRGLQRTVKAASEARIVHNGIGTTWAGAICRWLPRCCSTAATSCINAAGKGAARDRRPLGDVLRGHRRQCRGQQPEDRRAPAQGCQLLLEALF